jgi:hypothetical protein
MNNTGDEPPGCRPDPELERFKHRPSPSMQRYYDYREPEEDMRPPSKAEIAMARLTSELAIYRTYFQGHMTRELAEELLAGLKAMTDEEIVELAMSDSEIREPTTYGIHGGTIAPDSTPDALGELAKGHTVGGAK